MVLTSAANHPAAPPPRRGRALDDEAVSPVIGVILMVAITVVLAAVVFVLVGGFSEKAEKAPHITFKVDENARTLTVVRADPGADWKLHFLVGGTCADHVQLNGVDWTAVPDGTAVAAGDKLGNCASGETLTVASRGPNQLLASATFN